MPKTGINMSQAKKEFAEILEEIEQDLVKDVRELIHDAYLNVVGQPPSPVFTGFYASNHRILRRNFLGQFAAGGGGVAKLVPTHKDPKAPKGTYEGNIPSAVAEELAKVDNIVIGDIVTITTRVPYADEVEQVHGNYSRAEALLSFSD